MRKNSIGFISSILLLSGGLLLPGLTRAESAERADRTGLESVWKRSGRTTKVIDYPFSPQPGIYGGKTVREWGNRGYIFVNPRAEEFTRRRPRRPVDPDAPLIEPEDCREIRAELVQEVARSEQFRQERDRLAAELRDLRQTAEDRALKIEALEFQVEELERTAGIPVAPWLDPAYPDRIPDPTAVDPPVTDTYMVREGDNLWKIAGRPEIYNDPYRWLLLYHANRDQIFLPDLIYPGMILLVPRYRELEALPARPRVDEPAPEEPGEPEFILDPEEE